MARFPCSYIGMTPWIEVGCALYSDQGIKPQGVTFFQSSNQRFAYKLVDYQKNLYSKIIQRFTLVFILLKARLRHGVELQDNPSGRRQKLCYAQPCGSPPELKDFAV